MQVHGIEAQLKVQALHIGVRNDKRTNISSWSEKRKRRGIVFEWEDQCGNDELLLLLLNPKSHT